MLLNRIKNSMDKKNYILILIIIIGVMMILWGKEMNKNKIKKDLGDYEYTVGNVEAYFNRGTIGYNAGNSSITYSYTVSNIRYVHNYDMLFYKLPYSPNVNDKFVVAYNKKDPQKSLLLGDYPINTDEDFKVFINKSKDVKIDF